jgi:hypothetical protein
LFEGEVFSDPLLTIYLNPMIKIDNPLLEDSTQSWKDLKIRVVSGIGFEELYPAFDFDLTNSVDHNVRIFFSGRFEVLLENPDAIPFFIKTHLSEYMNDYVVLYQPLLETPISIGFSKKSSEEFHLDSLFNSGLKTIKQMEYMTAS